MSRPLLDDNETTCKKLSPGLSEERGVIVGETESVPTAP
jgi:hypothetical protein